MKGREAAVGQDAERHMSDRVHAFQLALRLLQHVPRVVFAARR